MRMKAQFAIAAFLLGLAGTPAVAESPSCASVSDSKARIACQMQKRRHYGVQLETSLFKLAPTDPIASSDHIFVEEAGDPGIGGYPRLIIWDFLSKDKVYNLLSEAKIVEGARAAGFKMIVFVDKGEDVNWYFDLTKPANVALDVVPRQNLPWIKETR